jgi:hypothetical protein
MTRLPVVFLVLGACGSVAAPVASSARAVAPETVAPEAEVAPPAAIARACPPASAVRLAVPREQRWTIPLGYVPTEEPVADADGYVEDPAPREVDRATLSERGIEAVPEVVWILQAGQPPCRARIAAFMETVVVDSGASLTFDAITNDDCAPAAPRRRAVTAWASDVEPGSACTLHVVGAPREIPFDADGAIPASPEPVPAPYAAHIPPVVSRFSEVSDERMAAAPALWAIRTVTGAPGISELWVTSVIPEPPDDPCAWYVEDYVALHLDDTGEPLHRGGGLAGLLVDDATRVVLLHGYAWSATYELAGRTLVPARDLEHFTTTGEMEGFTSMGPNCGP